MTEAQVDLFGPRVLTRAAAHHDRVAAAKARADEAVDGLSRRVGDDWIAKAVEAVRRFAAAQQGMFTLEMARFGVKDEVPRPHDLRAWGVVARMATKAGYIERVPKLFFPAASSNGSPKPCYRKGPKA